MTNLESIKSAVASEIYQLPKMSFDYRSNVENELLDSIESNGYCQPSEIGTTAEAWDLVWSEMARNLSYEKPDFSSCSSAFECVELEGQQVLNAAYYEATQEIVSNIANAIDECFSHDFGSLELIEMFIGKSGLGHIAHDYETDIADSSLCVWLASKMVEITIEGVTLYGVLTEIEDAVDDSNIVITYKENGNESFIYFHADNEEHAIEQFNEFFKDYDGVIELVHCGYVVG